MRSAVESKGDSAASSGIRWPSSAASSSPPTGLSSETGRLGGAAQELGLLEVHARVGGDVLEARLHAAVLGLELALGLVELLEDAVDVDRDPHRAGLVRDGARDRLTDPPGGVGRELEALAVVELLDGAHQADRALLDQLEEVEALVAVALGDRDHQPQVGLHHAVLGVEVAALDALGELDLLVRGQQRGSWRSRRGRAGAGPEWGRRLGGWRYLTLAREVTGPP